MCKCMRCPRMNMGAETMGQSRRTWAAFKCWRPQCLACALSGRLRTNLPPCRPGGSSLQPAYKILLSHCLCPRALTTSHSGWHAARHTQQQLMSLAMLPGHRRHVVGCSVTNQAHPGLGEPVRYPDAAKACTSARACVATALDVAASRAVRPAAAKSICSRGPLSRWCQL